MMAPSEQDNTGRYRSRHARHKQHKKGLGKKIKKKKTTTRVPSCRIIFTCRTCRSRSLSWTRWESTSLRETRTSALYFWAPIPMPEIGFVYLYRQINQILFHNLFCLSLSFCFSSFEPSNRIRLQTDRGKEGTRQGRRRRKQRSTDRSYRMCLIKC